MNPVSNIVQSVQLILLLLCIHAPVTLAAQDSVPLPKEQVLQQVKQLGADTFAERQDAMRQLELAGCDVMVPLIEAIRTGEPETQMRAMSVIARLATSQDRDCQKRAQDVLSEFLLSEDRDIRQLARQSVGKLGEAMQQRAIEDLRELGSQIDITEYFDGAKTTSIFNVVFKPGFEGTPDDYRMLTWLQGRTTLTLIGEQITDDVIRQLAGMLSLESLMIKRGKITNQAVESISRLTTIRVLNFYYVDIDDHCMNTLVGMKTLNQLRLFGTGISREKWQWAQQIMVSTDVDWRNGAFLGIYFNDTDGPCVVNNVVAASAADRAGFRPGDKVVGFAELKIETGRQFLRAVADYFPGDKAKAIVLRNGKEIELAFQLGRFPDIETFKNE